MTGLVYLAVGIDKYANHRALVHAVQDVETIRGVLGATPESVGKDLDETEVLEHVKKVASWPGQSLFFYWAGHVFNNSPHFNKLSTN